MKRVVLKKAIAVVMAAAVTLGGGAFAPVFAQASGSSSPWGDVNYVKEEQTKLVHLGYADYVTIAFQEGTIADYNLYMDGVKINEAVTKVDDEGTVVKWQTTVVKPGTLKIFKKDSPYDWQTIEITEGNPYVATKAGDTQDAPDYFLARGSISTFDYYLNPRNPDGTDKVLPAYTTFDLTHSRKANSDQVTTNYYVPEVHLNDPNIVAEFSVENEAQKVWFQGIDRITVLNQDNTIINDHIVYQVEMKENQYGQNGIITIPTGQDNMESCGIYQMNIHSTVSEETVTIPFELITDREFSMKLKTPGPKTGEDVKFIITDTQGGYYGGWLSNEQKTVKLTKPSGKEVTLKEIDDWAKIGEIFKVFGNVIDEAGIYEVSVKYTGYPKLTKKFEVFPNKSRRSGKQAVRQNPHVDAVSRATSSISIGGGGKPSTGGVMYQGKFVLNYDLVTNALILQELGCGNEASENVVEQYQNLTEVEYLYKEGAQQLYAYGAYVDAFCDKRMEGRESLCFAAYVKKAEPAEYSGPEKVQNMLEDGSFGYLTDFKFFKGEEAPEFTGLTALKGENFVIKAKDASFVKAITALYLDGMSAPLREDPYQKECEIDREQGTITIFKRAFNFYLVPEEHVHTLRIETGSGYRNVELKLHYVEELPKEEEPAPAENPAPEVKPIPSVVSASGGVAYSGGTAEKITAPENGKQEQEETVINEEQTPLSGEMSETAKDLKPGKVVLVKVTFNQVVNCYVKWKKVICNCSGYQVQIATKKNFAKQSIVKNVATKKTATCVKLKGNSKRFYVRVRAYQIKDGKKVYGAWSRVAVLKK